MNKNNTIAYTLNENLIDWCTYKPYIHNFDDENVLSKEIIKYEHNEKPKKIISLEL
jgi:hypothetical protein